MSIHVRNLTKKFTDFAALDGVSLDIGSGELVALLGPSGSGKTTLLRIIAGLEVANSGTVEIEGREASTLHVRERHVGFVFQHYALFRHMTVFENVAFGLTVLPKEKRPSRAEIEARVMKLLALVHLERFHARYPSQLSGGQRQRVALARALAVEPKLLLLDEPFGALDAKVRKELRRWLRRLHDDMHITTLFVTHDQEEAMEVADRVIVMNHGRIEQAGTPEEVYHRPANGFVYDFLGNYNEFAGWRDEHGKVHLAEDDLWEPVEDTLPSPVMQQATLAARYPALGRVMRRFASNPLAQVALGAAQPKVTRRQLKAELARRGTPVRMYARPHEMFITRLPDHDHEYLPVRVLHINPAGALATLELERENGMMLQAEIPKTILDDLAIKRHDAIFVRPKNVRVFE